MAGEALKAASEQHGVKWRKPWGCNVPKAWHLQPEEVQGELVDDLVAAADETNNDSVCRAALRKAITNRRSYCRKVAETLPGAPRATAPRCPSTARAAPN